MFCGDMYVYGDQTVKVPAHLNFGKFILDRLRLKSEEIALVNGETREIMTYKELTQYAVNMAAALTKLGVERGDIVAVGSEKRNEFVPTILAILFTGATYTPYDLNSGLATLKHKINISKPKYFIVSNRFWNTYCDILKEFECINTLILLDDDFEPTISIKTLVTKDVDLNNFQPADVHGQSDIAIIFYSSGTTSMPKGVQLTHLNCILNSLPDEFADDSLQTAFIVGEWFHSYDAFVTYRFLYMGRKIVYLDDDNPMFLKCVEDCKINIAFVVPAFICFILKINNTVKYNLDSLKILYSVSTPLHSKTLEEIKRRLPTVQCLQAYGMTETDILLSQMWDSNGHMPGSVGMTSPGKILKVVDPQTGLVLGPNQRGEICAKGPSIMKGYIGVDPSAYLDKDIFFKTGDLGYYDDNKNFYIVDRLKEIIEYQGCKIAPLELESILEIHPSVREAAVVGRKVPEKGEEPTAFVVKQPGVHVTEQDLVEYVATEVPPYMKLRGGVHFIEKIPRNSRGKILRRLLRKMLE